MENNMPENNKDIMKKSEDIIKERETTKNGSR